MVDYSEMIDFSKFETLEDLNKYYSELTEYQNDLQDIMTKEKQSIKNFYRKQGELEFIRVEKGIDKALNLLSESGAGDIVLLLKKTSPILNKYHFNYAGKNDIEYKYYCYANYIIDMYRKIDSDYIDCKYQYEYLNRIRAGIHHVLPPLYRASCQNDFGIPVHLRPYYSCDLTTNLIKTLPFDIRRQVILMYCERAYQQFRLDFINNKGKTKVKEK